MQQQQLLAEAAQRLFAVDETVPWYADCEFVIGVVPSSAGGDVSSTASTPSPLPSGATKRGRYAAGSEANNNINNAFAHYTCPIMRKYQVQVTDPGRIPDAGDDADVLLGPAQRWSTKGFIPHGSRGQLVCFGERWHFSIDYTGKRVQCASDGRERVLVAFGIRNEAWEEPLVLEEDEREAALRDRQGFTICGKTFTRALHRRAEDFRAELLATSSSSSETDEGEIRRLECKITQFTPHRFPEGPVLFGLRDKQHHQRQ